MHQPWLNREQIESLGVILHSGRPLHDLTPDNLKLTTLPELGNLGGNPDSNLEQTYLDKIRFVSARITYAISQLIKSEPHIDRTAFRALSKKIQTGTHLISTSPVNGILICFSDNEKVETPDIDSYLIPRTILAFNPFSGDNIFRLSITSEQDIQQPYQKYLVMQLLFELNKHLGSLFESEVSTIHNYEKLNRILLCMQHDAYDLTPELKKEWIDYNSFENLPYGTNAIKFCYPEPLDDNRFVYGFACRSEAEIDLEEYLRYQFKGNSGSANAEEFKITSFVEASLSLNNEEAETSYICKFNANSIPGCVNLKLYSKSTPGELFGTLVYQFTEDGLALIGVFYPEKAAISSITRPLYEVAPELVEMFAYQAFACVKK